MRTDYERQPEDSQEYLNDLSGHNQEVLWERVQEASQASDAQIEYEALEYVQYEPSHLYR